MSETIARLGQEIRGRPVTVVANVSNFVPKPQTPFQWHAMQRREYFRWAHEFLHRRNRLRSVQLRCHDIEASLLEGVMCRATVVWARQSSWLGVAAPVSTAGLSSFARAMVASDRRRRHRRGKDAPSPCPAGAPLPWTTSAFAGAGYLERECRLRRNKRFADANG